MDWTVFSGIFIAASDEVLPEDALTEALKYIETNKNYKKTHILILKNKIQGAGYNALHIIALRSYKQPFGGKNSK